MRCFWAPRGSRDEAKDGATGATTFSGLPFPETPGFTIENLPFEVVDGAEFCRGKLQKDRAPERDIDLERRLGGTALDGRCAE